MCACLKNHPTLDFGDLKGGNVSYLEKISAEIRSQNLDKFRELRNLLNIFKLSLLEIYAKLTNVDEF